jgi:hypothetical protein
MSLAIEVQKQKDVQLFEMQWSLECMFISLLVWKQRLSGRAIDVGLKLHALMQATFMITSKKPKMDEQQ